MSDQQYLTVAEAAVRLGFTIPRLRRLLARPQFASHCKSVERQTRTGTRTALVIPLSLLFQIGDEAPAVDKPEQKQEREQADPVQSARDLTVVYERIIAEKDARIKDLTEALEHERERSRRHAENYARVQTLLSLSNPP